MAGLPAVTDPHVLVGYETNDDAGVYRLRDDLALVQTVDVLTPIVDDPRLFGQIAAANSLSDIYAMGGRPLTALNFLALPLRLGGSLALPDCEGYLDMARAILAGGAEKVAEAGAVLLGGHTIDDPELKFGLCVTGTVHPDRILRNSTARPGDGLVLTKPLGTGIVATALKAGLASAEHAAAAAASMAQLNAAASQAALSASAHACTDVTGFGLVGHLVEMLAASGVAAVLEAARVPLLPGARDYAAMGLRTAAAARTREFFGCKVDVAPTVDPLVLDLLYDAQTSGGLLLACPDPGRLLALLRAAGISAAALIGHFEPAPAGHLRII